MEENIMEGVEFVVRTIPGVGGAEILGGMREGKEAWFDNFSLSLYNVVNIYVWKYLGTTWQVNQITWNLNKRGR